MVVVSSSTITAGPSMVHPGGHIGAGDFGGIDLTAQGRIEERLSVVFPDRPGAWFGRLTGARRQPRGDVQRPVGDLDRQPVDGAPE